VAEPNGSDRVIRTSLIHQKSTDKGVTAGLGNECSIKLKMFSETQLVRPLFDGSSVSAKPTAGNVFGGWERLRHPIQRRDAHYRSSSSHGAIQ